MCLACSQKLFQTISDSQVGIDRIVQVVFRISKIITCKCNYPFLQVFYFPPSFSVILWPSVFLSLIAGERVRAVAGGLVLREFPPNIYCITSSCT